MPPDSPFSTRRLSSTAHTTLSIVHRRSFKASDPSPTPCPDSGTVAQWSGVAAPIRPVRRALTGHAVGAAIIGPLSLMPTVDGVATPGRDPVSHWRETVGMRSGAVLDLSRETGYNRVGSCRVLACRLRAKGANIRPSGCPYTESEYTRRRAGYPAPVVFRSKGIDSRPEE